MLTSGLLTLYEEAPYHTQMMIMSWLDHYDLRLIDPSAAAIEWVKQLLHQLTPTYDKAPHTHDPYTPWVLNTRRSGIISCGRSENTTSWVVNTSFANSGDEMTITPLNPNLMYMMGPYIADRLLSDLCKGKRSKWR